MIAIKSFARGPFRGYPATIALAFFSGCSGTTAPATTETHLPAEPKQAAVSSLPAAAAPSDVPSKNTRSKGTVIEKTGNVALQFVTPDEFKKIIADQKGKVVLVDFWATYCAPCRAQFPKTLELAKKLGSQGFTAISMSMDEPREKAKVLHFLQEQNAGIINLANKEDSETAFGALEIDGGALPHYKIFGRKGNLRRKFGGDPDRHFDEKDVEKEVLAALQEK